MDRSTAARGFVTIGHVLMGIGLVKLFFADEFSLAALIGFGLFAINYGYKVQSEVALRFLLKLPHVARDTGAAAIVDEPMLVRLAWLERLEDRVQAWRRALSDLDGVQAAEDAILEHLKEEPEL